MNTPAPISARPAIYIDLFLPNGSKQVLEFEVAKAMHKQLGLAIQAVEPDFVPPQQMQNQTGDKTESRTNTPQPDDLQPSTPDDAPAVEAVDIHPAA